MEPLDSASAAWLTFTICKQASICWLSATQHPSGHSFNPLENRFRRKILKNFCLPLLLGENSVLPSQSLKGCQDHRRGYHPRLNWTPTMECWRHERSFALSGFPCVGVTNTGGATPVCSLFAPSGLSVAPYGRVRVKRPFCTVLLLTQEVFVEILRGNGWVKDM